MFKELTYVSRKYWFVFVITLLLSLPGVPISMIFAWFSGTLLKSNLLGFISGLLVYGIIATAPLIYISWRASVQYGDKNGKSSSSVRKCFLLIQGTFMIVFLLIGAAVFSTVMLPSR